MIWALALAIWACVMAGVYLAMTRDILRVVLGLALIGNGVNLALLAAGRVGGNLPAVVVQGQQTLDAAATNPLPQALILTAIVIGFGLMCFSLVLVKQLVSRGKVDDAVNMRLSEPVPTDPIKPPYADTPPVLAKSGGAQ